jgi:hypothetical protein
VKRRSRRSGRYRAFDWKRLPKILLLSVGAAGLGWLAVQAAAVEAFAGRNPPAAARFAPGDPRVPMGQAMLEFRQKAGAVSPATTRRSLAALSDAPLAEEPFLLAGLSAMIAERPAEAAPLLAEARRRNPRSRVSRLLLLDRYLRTGNTDAAVGEIAALGRLIPEANRVLVPELARLSLKPDSAAAAADVLRSDPVMRDGVLDHLSATRTPPDRILALAERSGRIVPGETAPWQHRLLQGLVERNDLTRARNLWSRFAGVDAKSLTGVYNPRFERLPGPGPFNWTFASSSNGAAEPVRGPALQVEYYGRGEAELASQLVALAPGRYSMAFRASGNTPGGTAAVSWRLSCHPSSAEIMSLPIQKLSYTPAVRRGQFTVPAGCSAQWLRLIGTPAEFPAAHSITISDLQVRRAGAA